MVLGTVGFGHVAIEPTIAVSVLVMGMLIAARDTLSLRRCFWMLSWRCTRHRFAWHKSVRARRWHVVINNGFALAGRGLGPTRLRTSGLVATLKRRCFRGTRPGAVERLVVIDRIIPGELLTDEGELILNPGRRTHTLVVENASDRPIQVGSHYHFAETNAGLRFDRAAAMGMRLNIASGTAVRFEPGQQRTVELVDLGGARQVYGFRGLVNGPVDQEGN